jgi:hypothetical protein
MSNNKAREINSPLIKQLINETSPEELAKIDTDMTNNKQQTAVEWLWEIAYNRELTVEDWKQAKEKYEHEMCLFADEYASYVQEQSKEGIKGAMVSMCAWTFFKNRRK